MVIIGVVVDLVETRTMAWRKKMWEWHQCLLMTWLQTLTKIKNMTVISMSTSRVDSMKKLTKSQNLERRIVMITIPSSKILTTMKNQLVSIPEMSIKRVGNYRRRRKRVLAWNHLMKITMEMRKVGHPSDQKRESNSHKEANPQSTKHTKDTRISMKMLVGRITLIISITTMRKKNRLETVLEDIPKEQIS